MWLHGTVDRGEQVKMNSLQARMTAFVLFLLFS